MTAANDTEMNRTTTPPSSRRAIVLTWAVFWTLMIARAVHEHSVIAGRPLWEPLLWEGSAMLVATVILGWQWRRIPRLDPLLPTVGRWLGRALLPGPVLALCFVAAVYALRHAVHALVGQPYTHAPWPSVLLFESLQFLIFYLLFLGVIFAMRSHAALTAQRVDAERQQALLRQAQLLQLAQQIEPHFLFNALNTIASLVHDDPDRADHLLLRLAGLLRAATDLARRPESTLAEEMNLLRAYADLMCERFDGRVAVHFAVEDGALACRVPTLSLQPLLENCFRHGVERKSGPARIHISAHLQAGQLHLAVRDDAGCLEGEARFGVGLGNVRDRLHAMYGEAARIELSACAGGGVEARMELPCAC